jgi:hypothetical protein
MFAKNLPYPLGEKELLERFGESQLKYVWVAPPNILGYPLIYVRRGPYINYGPLT